MLDFRAFLALRQLLSLAEGDVAWPRLKVAPPFPRHKIRLSGGSTDLGTFSPWAVPLKADDVDPLQPHPSAIRSLQPISHDLQARRGHPSWPAPPLWA